MIAPPDAPRPVPVMVARNATDGACPAHYRSARPACRGTRRPAPGGSEATRPSGPPRSRTKRCRPEDWSRGVEPPAVRDAGPFTFVAADALTKVPKAATCSTARDARDRRQWRQAPHPRDARRNERSRSSVDELVRTSSSRPDLAPPTQAVCRRGATGVHRPGPSSGSGVATTMTPPPPHPQR